MIDELPDADAFFVLNGPAGASWIAACCSSHAEAEEWVADYLALGVEAGLDMEQERAELRVEPWQRPRAGVASRR